MDTSQVKGNIQRMLDAQGIDHAGFALLIFQEDSLQVIGDIPWVLLISKMSAILPKEEIAKFVVSSFLGGKKGG